MSGDIIVNATAPVDELKITVDNRYNPPKIGFAASRALPGSWVMSVLNDVMRTLINVYIQHEFKPQPEGNTKAESVPPAS